MQFVRHVAFGASEFALPRSHVSTPVWTKPSPQLAARQLTHASVLTVFASSQSSPVSVTPLPQQGVIGSLTQTSFVSSQTSDVQALPSAHDRAGPAVQLPPWHVSFTVQKAPSSHVVPFGRLGCVHAPALHTSLVHWLPSSVQEPVRGVKTQPVAGLHVSVVHSLVSSQTRGAPGWHTPDTSQVSPTVQALLSLQLEPVGSGAFTHVSFVSSHESAVQGFVSAQLRAVPPVHVPPWHDSFTVQNWPSEHAVPFALLGCVQKPDAQTSLVHGLPSSVQALPAASS